MSGSGLHDTNEDALGRIVDDLEKYAGWLGNRGTARHVRSDVQALRAVLEDGDYGELRDSVQALLIDVAQLSDSATRALIQKQLHLLRKVAM